MTRFYHADDLSYAPLLMKAAPNEAQAFIQLKASAERSDGHIPPKYRELISIAVALASQCPYCIDDHVKKAKAAGATREEVAEAVLITAALRAGAAVGHGLMAAGLFEGAPAAG